LSLVMTSMFERAPLSRARRDYDHCRIWLSFTRRLSLPLGPDEIARELIDHAGQASGAASAAVYLADDGDGTYRLNARVGRARFARAIEPAAGLPAWLRLASSPALLPARLLPSVALPPLPAALAVPIRWRTTVLGVLVLACTDATDDDRELLATLADQAAASIKASRLAEEAAQPRRIPALDRVASTAIHDIKNSVSALSMLVSNAATHLSDPEFQRDAVATLVRTVERMRRLLVRLSSPLPDAPPTVGEPIDLRALIVEATGPLAAQPRIRLVRRLHPVGPVHGDREALLRVVENLTTNAVEAIDGEGTVTVALDEADGHAVVTVADTGCGIADDFRERRLFSPHQSTKQGGWGLGLYQTKHAVESQGGEILVESRVGHGTTFTVKLPLHTHAETTCLESV
jgi:putative PEP-CTERM system histidine kinase